MGLDLQGLLLAELNRLTRPEPSASDRPTDLAGLLGRLLPARVIAQPDPGRVLMEVLGRQLEAPNPLGLKPGQELAVKLAAPHGETGPIEVKVVTPPGEARSPVPPGLITLLTAPRTEPDRLGPAIRELIDLLARPGEKAEGQDDRPPQRALAALRQSLIPVDPQSPRRAAQALVQLPDRLGLNLEAKLAQAAAGQGRREAIQRLAQAIRGQFQSSTPPQTEPEGQADPVTRTIPGERAAATGQSRAEPTTDPAALAQGLKPRLEELVAFLSRPGPGREPDWPSDGGRRELETALGRVVKLLLPASGGRETAAPTPGQAQAELEAAAEKVIDRLAHRAEEHHLPAEARQRAVGRIGAALKALAARVESGQVKAADPQALALELRQAVERQLVRLGLLTQPRTDDLVGRAQEVVRGLETVQIINTAAADNDTAYLLPLPLLLPQDETVGGEMYFFQSRRENEGQSGPLRLVFLLEMSRLGPVRADVGLDRNSQTATVRLYLTEHRAVDFVRDQSDRLGRALAKLGYKTAGVEVSTLDRAPTIDRLATAEPAATSERSSLIDLKA